MNRYGSMAMTHWRQKFPQDYQQIDDPQDFFTALGQQVAQEIATLEAELTDQLSANYLENMSSIRTARTQAEEIVLARLVWRTEELDETDQQTGSDSPVWTPLVEDPADPWWSSQEHDPHR